jgi:hypothetical protein
VADPHPPNTRGEAAHGGGTGEVEAVMSGVDAVMCGNAGGGDEGRVAGGGGEEAGGLRAAMQVLLYVCGGGDVGV